MSETASMVLVFVTGVLLGAVFFGGLWWTVRHGVSSKHPGLLFLSSLLLRTSVALLGLYFVSDGHWKRLLVCLFGFVVARLFVTRLIRLPLENQSGPAQKVSHAS